MIAWLQSLSLPILALALMGGTTALSGAALLIVRRLVEDGKLAANNELGGLFFNMVGVMYAIILAFMVFAVWDQYQSAGRIAQDEATTLDSMYRDSTVFPGVRSEALRVELRNYGQAIVDKEWPLMAQRKESTDLNRAIDRIWNNFEQLEPQTEQQKAFYTEMTHNLNLLHTLREERLETSRSSLPKLLWVVVMAGGVITMSYVIYFGHPLFKSQILMTATLAVSISFIVMVVLALDNPFSGDVSVKPDALQSVLADMALR